MNHDTLVQRAERWLRNTRHCSAVICETVSKAGEIPDAIGWTGPHSILVECKTSRSDFKADAEKVWRRLDCIGMGEKRFFLCQPGVIRITDLPTRWGLLWVEPNRVCVIRESEQFERSWQNEMTLLVSALRRQRPEKCPGKAHVPSDKLSIRSNEQSDRKPDRQGQMTMPVATKAKVQPLCPEQEDAIFLLEVVTEETNKPDAKYNPGEIQWVWKFKSIEDADGNPLVDEMWEEPFEIFHYTGTTYGDSRAKLTAIIDKIAKNLPLEEKENFDTTPYENKKYRVDVVHKMKQDKSGMKAVLENIRPFRKPAATPPDDAAQSTKAVEAKTAPKAAAKPAPKPAPAADAEETEDDPFDDE